MTDRYIYITLVYRKTFRSGVNMYSNDTDSSGGSDCYSSSHSHNEGWWILASASSSTSPSPPIVLTSLPMLCFDNTTGARHSMPMLFLLMLGFMYVFFIVLSLSFDDDFLSISHIDASFRLTNLLTRQIIE